MFDDNSQVTSPNSSKFKNFIDPLALHSKYTTCNTSN